MLKSTGMNIGIFCVKDSTAAAKIKVEAEKRGHSCRRMRLADLFIEVSSEGIKVQHRKVDLNDFDVFIFRKTSSSESEIASITAKYLKDSGKKIIDESVLIPNNELLDLEKLSKANLPLLKRVITPSMKSSRDVLMEFEHPVIVKPLDLSSERYSFSEDWTESYDIVRTEKSRKYEIIQAMDTDTYTRVFVIGFEVAGAMERKSADPEKRLNLSRKTFNTKIDLDDAGKEICTNAAKSVGYEVCTVDLVQTEEGWKIIELDRSPKFASFNKLFGEKFEGKMIDYIESLMPKNLVEEKAEEN